MNPYYYLRLCFGLLIFYYFCIFPCFGGDPPGILLEVGLGTFGSASELIFAPLSGKVVSDPNWVYEILPDGTPNPRFRKEFPLPGVVNSVPLPGDLNDSAGILGNAVIIDEN